MLQPDNLNDSNVEPDTTTAHRPEPLSPPISVPLTTLPAHPCAYLPGRTAQSRALRASQMPGEMYRQFMDAGFRRSGQIIYQPICPDCRACVPIRVLVNQFKPDKSQRRAWRHNQDIAVSIDAPGATDEAFDLYRRYVSQWHGKSGPGESGPGKSGPGEEDTREAFERFLYESPVSSVEFKYRDRSGRLLAVGIADICGGAFSSVYFFFDPDEKHRSLGTFGAVYELDFAKSRQIEFYYLGYWIEGCGAMQYKNRFRPCELLDADGRWALVR